MKAISFAGKPGCPLLSTRGIVKHFGDVLANDHIDLTLKPGQIHALLGENGAGKSTFVKILYGALQPDAGRLEWNGNQVTIPDPASARRLGIAMIFQHFSLIESLSVLDNIRLGLSNKRRIADLREQIGAVSSSYGLELQADALVSDLSAGERQRIEIIRCLMQKPRLLILDEPTSVLTPQEVSQLFQTLERVADDGCAMLYISHRLDEVRQLCRVATILRDGRVIAQLDPSRESSVTLARHMVGTEVPQVRLGPAPTLAEARIELRHVCRTLSDPYSVSLRDIELDVRAGEIVGIAGIAGNGQTELFDVLTGEKMADDPNSICLSGAVCGRQSISDRRRLDIGFVAEERLGHGAAPDCSLSDNALLTRHATQDGLVSTGFRRIGKIRQLAARIVKQFDVRTAKKNPEAKSLSGGNLQKFIVGRELDRHPGTLIASQPTWGVDAGSASRIRQELIDLARAGSAVLVFSQDLDELFEITNRMAVMVRGELSPIMNTETVTREQIGLMMTKADCTVPGSEMRTRTP